MEKEILNNETKKQDSESKPEKVKLQAPTGFKEKLPEKISLLESILRAVLNPIVLVGGGIAAIYLLYKAWQSGVFDSKQPKLDGVDSSLSHEIKALKKENKKLRQQLAFLSEDSNYHRNESKLLNPAKRKVNTVYLD